MKSKKTSIVILTFNNLHYTIECVNSIRNFTGIGEYEIIIVDNNSTDETREWLKNQEDIKCILNDKNEGFPKGVNLGIKATDGESDVLLLNNDTVVTPNWLDKLRTALYSDDTIGAVGPVSNAVANQQDIVGNYTSFNEMINFADEREKNYCEIWEEKHLLIGFCFLVKREVLNKIGILDELYTPGNYEDCDFSLRIVLAGYKLLLCHDTFIHHAGSATFRAFPEIYSHFGANRLKFEEKWGWNHDLISAVRLDLIDLIKCDEPKKILEVGCGSGMNLLKLKFKNKDNILCGIEEVEDVCKITKQLLGIDANHKIEEYPYDLEENYFDYILIGDLLSYLDNPMKFLCEIKKYLSSNGKIIMSVENITYVKSIINFLNNGILGEFKIADYKFNKRVKNLLTLNDIYNLLQISDLKPITITYVGEKLSDVEENLINALLDYTSRGDNSNYGGKTYYIQVSK